MHRQIIITRKNVQIPYGTHNGIVGTLQLIEHGTTQRYTNHTSESVDGGISSHQSIENIPYSKTLLICDTLELPWNNNQRNISSIPQGIYMGQRETHSRLGQVIRITGVPGRDGILIHTGNDSTATSGCILVGQLTSGQFSLTQSRNTMNTLWTNVGNSTISIQVF